MILSAPGPMPHPMPPPASPGLTAVLVLGTLLLTALILWAMRAHESRRVRREIDQDLAKYDM